MCRNVHFSVSKLVKSVVLSLVREQGECTKNSTSIKCVLGLRLLTLTGCSKRVNNLEEKCQFTTLKLVDLAVFYGKFSPF